MVVRHVLRRVDQPRSSPFFISGVLKQTFCMVLNTLLEIFLVANFGWLSVFMPSFTWTASATVQNESKACELLTAPSTYQDWSRTFRCMGKNCEAGVEVGSTFVQSAWCGSEWCETRLEDFVYVSESCKIGWVKCVEETCKENPLFPQSLSESWRVRFSRRSIMSNRTNWISNGTFHISEELSGWLAPLVYITNYNKVDVWFKRFVLELSEAATQT
jgi:hypothetical protein